MSAFNDSDWTKEMPKSVLGIPNKSRTTQKRFQRGHWSSWAQETKTSGMGRTPTKPEGKWNTTAENMVEDFKETGHPIFRGISALNRGVLKRRGWRCTVNPLLCGISECRAFVSHDSLSKPVMYLRSSSELVWRFGSADSWSNACDHVLRDSQCHDTMFASHVHVKGVVRGSFGLIYIYIYIYMFFLVFPSTHPEKHLVLFNKTF